MSEIVKVAPSGRAESAVEKREGYAFVQAWERDRLISLVEVACREACDLLHKTDRYSGRSGLSDEECRPIVDEVLRCLGVAENYARMLADCVGIYRPVKSWSGEPAF